MDLRSTNLFPSDEHTNLIEPPEHSIYFIDVVEPVIELYELKLIVQD